MSISFTKKNLAYLLLIANLERKKGRFIDPLIDHLSDAVDQYLRERKVLRNKISRATMFNYLSEIDELMGGGYKQEQTNDLAAYFEQNYPNKINKYYNQFNDVLFNALYDYLTSNDALDRDKLLDTVSSIDHNLYFSIASFLGIDQA